MDFKEIQELIKIINRSNLTEFKLKDGEFELAIRTAKYQKARAMEQGPHAPMIPMQSASVPVQHPFTMSQTPPQTKPAQQAEGPAPAEGGASEEPATTGAKKLLEIKSPMVGTFYRSSSPEKPAYAKVGDRVEKGDVVCIVEAMKLFNEIESEISGTIVKVLVEDAQPVEYDQVLFLVEP